jgi:hypothetical protein
MVLSEQVHLPLSMTNDRAHVQMFTLTEAAKLTGVSRSTIRRRRESGKFPDAYRNPDGEWMIPLTNLLAEGLRPISSERVHLEQAGALVKLTPPPEPDRETLNRLIEAEKELAAERARREGLERTLAATEGRVVDLQKAMAMLEAPRPQPSRPATPPPPAEPVGWWAKLWARE